jgi:hypothetical protein
MVTAIGFTHRQWDIPCGLGFLVRQSDFLKDLTLTDKEAKKDVNEKHRVN